MTTAGDPNLSDEHYPGGKYGRPAPSTFNLADYAPSKMTDAKASAVTAWGFIAIVALVIIGVGIAIVL